MSLPGVSRRRFIDDRVNFLRTKEGLPGCEEGISHVIEEIFKTAEKGCLELELELLALLYPPARDAVENWKRKVETKAVPAMPRTKARTLAVA
jgi:hypothetical protein